jgi:hypothetical protein
LKTKLAPAPAPAPAAATKVSTPQKAVSGVKATPTATPASTTAAARVPAKLSPVVPAAPKVPTPAPAPSAAAAATADDDDTASCTSCDGYEPPAAGAESGAAEAGPHSKRIFGLKNDSNAGVASCLAWDPVLLKEVNLVQNERNGTDERRYANAIND